MLIIKNLKITTSTKRKLEKELQIAENLNNLRLYKIIQALLLLAQNYTIQEITDRVHVKIRVLYDWVHRFIAERFSWLIGLHFPGRGRKSKLTEKQKEKLYDIVVQGPQKAGYDCGGWNSAMIAEVIQKQFNVTYNPRYVCDLLKKRNLSFQKAKFVSDSMDDSEHIKARRRWKCVTWPCIRKQAKKLNGVILFGDEVSFAQWGSLAKTWAPCGVQPLLKTAGKRKSMKIFGAIEFNSGDFLYKECAGKFNGETYMDFLQQILDTYSCPVFLIEDGAPYHIRKDVKTFTDKMMAAGRLFVTRLPTYSPDFNPIEKLWKQTKT